MSLESVRTITLGNSIFKIISSLVLIPFFGIIGAIASVLLSRVALALQVHFDIKKFRENQTKSDNKNNDE